MLNMLQQNTRPILSWINLIHQAHFLPELSNPPPPYVLNQSSLLFISLYLKLIAMMNNKLGCRYHKLLWFCFKIILYHSFLVYLWVVRNRADEMIAAGRQQTRFKIGDAFSHPTNENDCKNLDSVVTFVCHDKLSSNITGFIDFECILFFMDWCNFIS